MTKIKERCWIFKKTCLNKECSKEFKMKLIMSDRKAQELNQYDAMCQECTKEHSKKVAEEAVKMNELPEVKATANDPEDKENAKKLEKIINTDIKGRSN